ncbi:unnamed protein product [Rotaria sp. Silwood2]|nr:unnamed protein product [Rotaria sp. Silwood2]CAF2823158.1 unnamed protein product [Rotaria sp. Silwood2]CAF3032900.1 unnamed protein product [Rotaria sp. Silwood2]CAF3370636.1 unnamed protein product [Rotaria sp. Silwood2]CAF3902278.1 unnamed protein product [Rotaria sp. Silwood2]
MRTVISTIATTTTVTTSTITTTTATTATSSSSSSSTTTITTATAATTTTPSCTSSVGLGNILMVVMTSGWTQYSYSYVATNSEPFLLFTTTNTAGPFMIYLDDVSVVDISVPSVELLENPSFENSTTVPTGWITWCTSSCSISVNQVTASGCHTGSGNNCFMNRCRNYYDYIGQSFSAIIGHTYNISFWINQAAPGSGAFYATIN